MNSQQPEKLIYFNQPGHGNNPMLTFWSLKLRYLDCVNVPTQVVEFFLNVLFFLNQKFVDGISLYARSAAQVFNAKYLCWFLIHLSFALLQWIHFTEVDGHHFSKIYDQPCMILMSCQTLHTRTYATYNNITKTKN